MLAISKTPLSTYSFCCIPLLSALTITPPKKIDRQLIMSGGTAAKEKDLVTNVMNTLAEGDDQPFLDAMHDDIQWTGMGSGDP
jgi:hypothetical protein